MRYAPLSLLRVLVFHASALSVFLVGVSGPALVAFVVSWLARSFAISAGYHRYFTHRSYETGRGMRFLLALLGCTAGQRGPLSWTTSHVRHHANSDREGDPHSPVLGGFFHAHMGWFLRPEPLPTSEAELRRFADAPEILWLDRHYGLVFLGFLALLYGAGELAALRWPGASGAQLVVWGGLLSTLLLLHATCAINSLGHVTGARHHDTSDASGDIWWLLPVSFGENWHNGHHRFPWSANFGLSPGQLDPTFELLRLLQALGLIHGLRDAQEKLSASRS